MKNTSGEEKVWNEGHMELLIEMSLTRRAAPVSTLRTGQEWPQGVGPQRAHYEGKQDAEHGGKGELKEWRSKSGSMFDMCNHCHTRPSAMLGEVGQLVWFHQRRWRGT